MLEACGKENRILFSQSSAKAPAKSPETHRASWSLGDQSLLHATKQHQRKDDSSHQLHVASQGQSALAPGLK